MFLEVATKARTQASLALARSEFKRNATGTLAFPQKNSHKIVVTITFKDASSCNIKLKDWEWVRGW